MVWLFYNCWIAASCSLCVLHYLQHRASGLAASPVVQGALPKIPQAPEGCDPVSAVDVATSCRLLLLQVDILHRQDEQQICWNLYIVRTDISYAKSLLPGQLTVLKRYVI